MAISFSSIAAILYQVATNAPATLAFLQAIYAAWVAWQNATGNAPTKVQAFTEGENAEIAKLTAVVGKPFNGGLIRWLVEHPELAKFLFDMLKIAA